MKPLATLTPMAMDMGPTQNIGIKSFMIGRMFSDSRKHLVIPDLSLREFEKDHKDKKGKKVQISRNHAVITCERIDTRLNCVQWCLQDLSVNGCFVNNLRITNCVLKDGDIINFGSNAKILGGSSNTVYAFTAYAFTFKIIHEQYDPTLLKEIESCMDEAKIALAQHAEKFKNKANIAKKSVDSISAPDGNRKRVHAHIAAVSQPSDPVVPEIEKSSVPVVINKRQKVSLTPSPSKQLSLHNYVSPMRMRKTAYIDGDYSVSDMEGIVDLQAKIQRVTGEADTLRRELKLATSRVTHLTEVNAALEADVARIKELGGGFSVERVKAEFTCGICQQLIVGCATLSCSHSFCSNCIEAWILAQLAPSCPVCRANVVQPGIRSIMIDNSIQALSECFHERDRILYKKRCIEWSLLDQYENRLEVSLEKVSEKTDVAVLDISVLWSDYERRIFTNGIMCWPKAGRGRRLYISAVGLTAKSLAEASDNILLTMSKNLFGNSEKLPQETALLRKMILSWILGDHDKFSTCNNTQQKDNSKNANTSVHNVDITTT